MAELTKTATPGIFRAHRKACDRKGRCDCPYTVITRHRGQPKKETVATLGKAREVKGRRDSRDHAPTPTIRFGTYYRGWIDTYGGRTSQGVSEDTRDEYRRIVVKWLLPKWETWKLVAVEPKDEEADDKAKAMSREELGWLLAALPDDHRLFFEFLTHSGLRISEAAGLRWDQVDLMGRRLRIREQVYRGKRKKLKSKSGRRDLPISPVMADRLLEHRARIYLGEKASVFPSKGKLRKTKEGFAFPFDSKALARDVLIPTRESLGMDWVTFHTFRHTCASLLFAKGRNIKQVSDWLGHADPAFTLRTYVHLLDAGVGDADFFDDEVGPQGNPRATRGPKKAGGLPTAEAQDLAA